MIDLCAAHNNDDEKSGSKSIEKFLISDIMVLEHKNKFNI